MRLCAIAFALLPTATLGQSNTFCDSLSDLLDQTQTTDDVSFDHPTPTDCTRSLNLGSAPSVDCAWAFDYRSEAATEAFEDLLNQVSTCAIPIAATGPNVSHPDSYDLRQFQMGDGILSVSLKDKGALSQTYVFLRAQLGRL